MPLTISLHPLGLFLAVGFYDNIQIYALLYQDVICVKEIHNEGTGIIKYSNRGHYLLSNSGS